MTLGISDSNAILAALGALYRVDPDWQVFGELSGDILVGSKAPRFTDSPLRAAAGARWQLTPELQAEGTAVVALSTRPSLRPTAPWVPTEPRFMILLGLSYTWSLSPQNAAPEKQPEVEQVATKPIEEKPVLKLASVQGVIIDDRGQPVPDVRVTLVAADGTQLEAITEILEGSGWRHAPDPEAEGGTGYEHDGVRLELTYLVRRDDGVVVTPLHASEAPWPAGAFGVDEGELGGVRARLVSLDALTSGKASTREDPAAAAKDEADFDVLSDL